MGLRVDIGVDAQPGGNCAPRFARDRGHFAPLFERFDVELPDPSLDTEPYLRNCLAHAREHDLLRRDTGGECAFQLAA